MKWRQSLNSSRAMKLELGPVVVPGGAEAHVLKRLVLIPGTNRRVLKGVWSFHGLDRGDIAEMDTELYDGSVPLVLRSQHKETLTEFDSWIYYDLQNHVIQAGLMLVGQCRTNGHNTILQGRPLQTRPHWGVYLVWGEHPERERR